jgi:UDP-glucuronate 4-epimerase
MRDGRPIPFYGDGTTERDYTYIDDVVAGIESALTWAVQAEEGAFEVVNIGESRTTSLSRLVEMIAHELNAEPTLEHLPAQAGDVARTFASVDKARSLIGYDPRTTMEEGIRRFVEWFHDQRPT